MDGIGFAPTLSDVADSSLRALAFGARVIVLAQSDEGSRTVRDDGASCSCGIGR
ncbi:hypothetical protein [Allokutzneria albata]|uniref:hypothetical protein n=1 Tax=Allokutzneria albata TaxID=211114 RepID=UPI001E55C9FC|nr:hypothetical protein [Allokutzneria albata]